MEDIIGDPLGGQLYYPEQKNRLKESSATKCIQYSG
jgi:hypothetical protein